MISNLSHIKGLCDKSKLFNTSKCFLALNNYIQQISNITSISSGSNSNSNSNSLSNLFINNSNQYDYLSHGYAFSKKISRKKENQAPKKSNPNDRNKSLRGIAKAKSRVVTDKITRGIEAENEIRKENDLNKISFKNNRKLKKSKIEEDDIDYTSQIIDFVPSNREKKAKEKKINTSNNNNNNNNQMDNKSKEKSSKKEKKQEKVIKMEVQIQDDFQQEDQEDQIPESEKEQEIIIDAYLMEQLKLPNKPILSTDGQIRHFIPKDLDGMRADRWIKSRYPIVTHSLVCKWIREKKITLVENKDGTPISDAEIDHLPRKSIKIDTKLEHGQWIFLPAHLAVSQEAADKETPQKYVRLSDDEIKKVKESVLYKDDHLIIINKPQGLAVQGGSGLNKHLDMMLSHLKFDYNDPPKLVHRLDRGTSGILILARTKTAASEMASKFELVKEKKKPSSNSTTNNNKKDQNNNDDKPEPIQGVKKTYWALLSSTPEGPKEGRIRAPLKKVIEKGQEKIVACLKTGDGAKLAITEYKVVDNALSEQCFIVLWPETGRTHQLRVHCASILKSPIIGDTKYGDDKANKSYGSILGNKPTMHLHARRVEFVHPMTNKNIDIIAPLPPILRESWKRLGFDFNLNDKEFDGSNK
ncbi:hypothetical protein CYY_007744 [Polysphondylium violaceum]|uniref:Pseudouridine synthase RsuA/RluA-like domain-containing protein n=1 Tax=Polysphondylium violaceum TaxID=133409 RepID=A0A8J4PNW3_9MYCE|nr:hypothetical protein CYY_007744 [Polysphondylium violaceum]